MKNTKTEYPHIFGFLISAILTVVYVLGAVNTWPVVKIATGAITLAVAFLLPVYAAIVHVLIFAGCLLFHLPVNDALNATRIVAFGLIIIMTSRLLPKIPYYCWLILTWMVFLWLYVSQNIHSTNVAYEHISHIFYTIITEVVCLLLFTMLSATNMAETTSYFRKIDRSTRSFCIQFISLGTFIVSYIVSALFVYANNVSVESMLLTLLATPMQLAVFLAAIILIPLMMGLLLGQIVLDFTSTFVNTIKTNSYSLTSRKLWWIFSELENLAAIVIQSFQQYKSQITNLTRRNRDLEDTARTSKQESELREQQISNMLHVMDCMPIGTIAFQTNRMILETNRQIHILLNIAESTLSGKDISSLKSSHPWSKEIVTLLEWHCKKQIDCTNQSAYRFCTSEHLGYFLEIDVQVDSTFRTKLNSHKDSEHRLASEMVIIFYCRKVRDLRSFQLNLITPSKQVVIEKHALSLCSGLQEQFSSLLDDATELQKIVHSLKNDETTNNIKLLLQDIEKIANEGLIKTNIDNDSTMNTNVEEIDFVSNLQNGLDHLYDLLELPKRNSICFEENTEDTQTMKKHDITSTASHCLPYIHVFINKQDLYLFNTSLLSMLQCLLSHVPVLSILLATEHIGTTTANILSASVTGQFVRIDISHEGQSITPNMPLRTFSELSHSKRNLDPIETSIVLLTYQTKRLGGFVTVQSSTTKGTLLTIYIPVRKQKTSHLLSQTSSTHSLSNLMPKATRGDTRPQILLLSPKKERASTLSKMLLRLGYTVFLDDASGYEGDSDISFGFGGHGFDSANTSVFDQAEAENENRTTQVETATLYNLILLNITRNEDFDATKLHRIAKCYPDTPVLILHHDASFLSPFAHSTLLKKPFELEQLASNIKNLLNENSNA